MLKVQSVIGTYIFALLLAEVASWTIDLPVARKYFFERSKQKHGDANEIYFNSRPALYPYDNIIGDSPHNTQYRELDYGNYANQYGYLSYMEKKVHGIYEKGNIYLEGLRRAMERYSEQLEKCTRLERSRPPTNRTWVPELSMPVRMTPQESPESMRMNPQEPSDSMRMTSQGPPESTSMTPQELSPEEQRIMFCQKVTQESEHVRKLASLVVWVVKELQDLAYAKDFDKKTDESEEYVLLVQLAWALDELARLTGFEPDPYEYAMEPTPAPAPTTTPATYFNLPIPNDGPTNANCIKQNSAVPADIRCAVPVPDVVLQFLNTTNSSSSSSNNSQVQDTMMGMITMFNNSSSGNGQMLFVNMTPDEIRQQMLGCLSSAAAGSSNACQDFLGFMQFLNNNGQQMFQPRTNREADSAQLEILQEAEQNLVVPLQKPRSKRSTNDPLREFAVYLGKFKVWTNSNKPIGSGKSDSYDVKNDLTAVKTVSKRSISRPGIKILVPEYPMQDLSSHAKHQPNVHYVEDIAQANEIKSYLEKIYHKDIETAKDHIRKLDPLIKSVNKRSIYYQKLHRPRVPEDPMQDISYYVKNKPGTNIRPNLANAAMVRLGLQEIFERGNIEVIRRYGSNYIPGVAPLMAGSIESFTDI